MADTDHTSAWQEWESLLARRDRNPVDAMKEYLRREGWIVERPETLSLPVKVARSGSFTEADGYRVTLHVRTKIGDRLAQVDHQIDMQNAVTIPSRSFSDAIATKFDRYIMDELVPQIALGCEREILTAREQSNA